MKKLTVVLLSIIFTTLIIGPIQLISADHLEPGLGIFKNEKAINTISTEDSKYQIYLQVVVRNAQGQLISILEDSHGRYIPHEITDSTFDEKLGEREIITIDNIKYEKVQFTDTLDAKKLIDLIENRTSHFIGIWKYQVCEEIDGHGYNCIPIFHLFSSYAYVTAGDVITSQWTILREMN